MNKKFIHQIIQYLPLIITGIFIIAIFFFPVLLYISGIFAIAVLLSCLKKRKTKHILIILSPIITYPLFLIVTKAYTDGSDILNLPFHWLHNLTIYIVIYAILYGLIFKNIWKWFALNKRRLSILALTIIAVVTLFYGFLAAECHVTSNAEKGVSQEEISKCKLFNLYNPTRAELSGKFSGAPYAMIKIPTQGVGYASVIIVLILIYFEARQYNKSKKEK